MPKIDPRSALARELNYVRDRIILAFDDHTETRWPTSAATGTGRLRVVVAEGTFEITVRKITSNA